LQIGQAVNFKFWNFFEIQYPECFLVLITIFDAILLRKGGFIMSNVFGMIFNLKTTFLRYNHPDPYLSSTIVLLLTKFFGAKGIKQCHNSQLRLLDHDNNVLIAIIITQHY